MSVLAKNFRVVSIGFAMFSMFFGAGNIVFPLAVGQLSLDKNFWGVLGLILGDVIVSLIGLLAMLGFEGSYSRFFSRIGKWPGFLLGLMILTVIGPMGGIPRCITISYSTISAFHFENLSGMNHATFGLVSCLLIYLCTIRPNRILAILGYILTPILLLSLAVIFFKGYLVMPEIAANLETKSQVFLRGILGGYQMLDLFAAFFFSSMVLSCLDHGAKKGSRLKLALAGSIIAAVLLALVYIGFSHLGAGFGEVLKDVPPQELLGTLAHKLLGNKAGLVTCIAIIFACLTTEIALTAIVARYLHETLTKGKLSYSQCLILTLGVSFMVSRLRFDKLTAFLGPVLEICYPALIALAVLNLFYYLKGFQPVKRFFYPILIVSLLVYLKTHF